MIDQPAAARPQPIYTTGPRGGAIVICTCGTRNRYHRDRDRWTCIGCWHSWHGGPHPEIGTRAAQPISDEETR